MQKVLMIVGMHRSGTSLVTQWLYRCGLNVGSKLLAASTGNADGHYEDEDFLNLHCDWLVKRGLSSSGLIDHSPTPLKDDERLQLQALLAQKNAASSQWGWKEPRTCLWLPVYSQYLPEALYLIVIRKMNDTVNSLVMREFRIADKNHDQIVQRKKGLSWVKWNYLRRKRPGYYFKRYAEEYLRVCVHYYEKIIEQYEALPSDKYWMVSYEDLLTNDTQVLAQLIDQWKFSLQPVPFKAVFKKELLSHTRKISRYVKDKALLDKAKKLEAACLLQCQAQYRQKQQEAIA